MISKAKTGDQNISRREILKLGTSAVIGTPMVKLERARSWWEQASASPRFFTIEEFALVDELTEMIIPTDEHSPGARAARVAEYIDRQLAEAGTDKLRQQWREGLTLIDSLSQEMNNKPFLQASPEERFAILARISQNEMKPQKPEETFFRRLKVQTARGYYTSKIGIHQEMEYKGNTYLREFVGEEAK